MHQIPEIDDFAVEGTSERPDLEFDASAVDARRVAASSIGDEDRCRGMNTAPEALAWTGITPLPNTGAAAKPQAYGCLRTRRPEMRNE